MILIPFKLKHSFFSQQSSYKIFLRLAGAAGSGGDTELYVEKSCPSYRTKLLLQSFKTANTPSGYLVRILLSRKDEHCHFCNEFLQEVYRNGQNLVSSVLVL